MPPGEAQTEAIALAEAIAAGTGPAAASAASSPSTVGEPAPFGLSPRELDVLRLLTRRWTDAEIAESLFVSPRTVNTHVRSIFNKLGAANRREAAALAARHGLT